MADLDGRKWLYIDEEFEKLLVTKGQIKGWVLVNDELDQVVYPSPELMLIDVFSWIFDEEDFTLGVKTSKMPDLAEMSYSHNKKGAEASSEEFWARLQDMSGPRW